MSENIITQPDGRITGVTHTTDFQQYIGRSNPNDPFAQTYPDFPQTDAVLELGRKGGFSPTTLGFTNKSYICVASDMAKIAEWCEQPNYQFSYEFEEQPNGLFRMTIHVPYDEVTYEDGKAPEINQLELIPHSVARNIFDAGIYFTQANGQYSKFRYTVPPLLQAAIMYAVKNNGTLAINQDTCGENFAQYVQWASIANQFLYLIRAGVTSVQSYTPVLRRTGVYSVNDPNAFDNLPDFGENSNLDVINPIISTNDLISLYQIASTDVPFLPQSYSKFKTSTQPINGYADPVTLLVFGAWLIERPQRTFISPTKVQITQNFYFDEYIGNLYSGISQQGDFPLVGSTPYPQSS